MKTSYVVASLVAVLAVSSPARALTPAELDAWIAGEECTSSSDTNCLETIAYQACAAGCWRYGRNYRVSTPQRVDLHMTLEYLKKVRDTALAYPSATISRSFGQTLDGMLWHQVQAVLLAPNARFYGSDLSPIARTAVMSGNVVNPLAFHSVTWVTERPAGCPEPTCREWAGAMSQADFGLWLITVARGQPLADMTYSLRLSERVFRSFGIRAADGGVRNDRTGHRCHAGLYCYWFHSWIAEAPPEPGVVLNQHLHAVRDALSAHQQLADWRDEPSSTLPSEFQGAHIDQLREWGRGGLFQLAFALGNEYDASAPPNLEELLQDAGTDPFTQRAQYYAAYRYDLGVGPFDISAEKTCHYHFHSVEMLSSILAHLSTSPRFTSDPHFIDIRHALLYGREPGDPRSCSPSDPPTARDVRGVPLAELYLSSLPPDLYGFPWFQSNCDTELSATARTFYADAYTACTLE